MSEQLYQEIGSITPDNLIVGDQANLIFKGVTVLTGQGVLARGSVIGIITVGGKGKLCDKASADGSEVAKYILADDIDTTSEDIVAQCYQSGQFNRTALTFGGVSTAADHDDELRKYGIFLKDTISY